MGSAWVNMERCLRLCSSEPIMLSKDFRKDRSLQRYPILEILTNPATDIKYSNISGKKSTAIFAFHLLLFQDKISSFSGKVASRKPVERKTTKRGTKLDPYV